MGKILKILIIALSLVGGMVNAQTALDSLQNKLKVATTDTARANRLEKIGRYYLAKNQFDSSFAYADKALKLSKKINYTNGIAQANSLFGSVAFIRGDYRQSLTYRQESFSKYELIGDSLKMGILLVALGSSHQTLGELDSAFVEHSRALVILQQVKNQFWIATCYQNLGIVSFYRSDYDKSLENYTKALKLFESLNEQKRVADVSINIGHIYNYQNNYAKALEKYKYALEIHKKLGNKYGWGACTMSLGHVLGKLGKPDEALQKFLEAYEISKEINNSEMLAISLYNIGSSFAEMKEYDKALSYHFQAYAIQEKSGNKQAMAQTLNDIAITYTLQKKYPEAKKHFEKSLQLALEMKVGEDIKRSYRALATFYEKTGDYKSALEYSRKFTALNDSILSKETTQKINEMSAKYDSEKKQKEIELLTKDKEVTDSRSRNETALKNILIGGFAAVLILLFIFYSRYSVKKRANNLLAEKNLSISRQRDEIESQKVLVEERNKEITDSIKYAKTIQNTILPPAKDFMNKFPDSFVLYKPKDIVSGDFYWITENKTKLFAAAVDCTGHGVPGAMMSMIGFNFLKQIVNEQNITDTSEILEELHKKILFALNHDLYSREMKDGMDVALLSIDLKNKKAQFAGAARPLYYYQNNELKIISSDVYSIGGIKEINLPPFSKHDIDISSPTSFYLFSDGYADQFGGPKGKKFKYKQLQEIIRTIEAKPMKEQGKILEQEMEKWMKHEEQVDDMMILGMKFLNS